jgi:GNAT superfamily N-acetyltransferase
VTLAERVAGEYVERLRSFGDRAPGRFVAEVAGLTVVSVGVDEPWGLQVMAMVGDVDPAAVDVAVAWCRDQEREPQVVVRERDAGRLPSYRVVDELPALVAAAEGSQDVLDVEASDDVDEFRDVYGSSFEMRPGLAESLVVAADLAVHPHLIGRLDGNAVACAQVRPGVDMAYVNGVGVLPAQRGRGYGAAMLAACRVEAAARGCELVWLNASPTSVGFYEAIGFELVDTHVALAAS